MYIIHYSNAYLIFSHRDFFCMIGGVTFDVHYKFRPLASSSPGYHE